MQELQRIVNTMAKDSRYDNDFKVQGLERTSGVSKQDLLDNARITLTQMADIEKTDYSKDAGIGYDELAELLSRDKCNYYTVCQDLGKSIEKLKLSIPVKHLPLEFDGIIEFHDYIATTNYKTKLAHIQIEDGMLKISLFSNTGLYVGGIFMDLAKHGYDSIISEKLFDSVNPGTYQEVASTYILNTLLYINMPDSDLQTNIVRPSDKLKKPSKLRQHFKKHGMFDTIQVGYSFHGRTSHVDSWGVSGHWRWQPTNSGVKLIWIKEHSRSSHKKIA